MKITIAQLNYHIGNFKRNKDLISNAIKKAFNACGKTVTNDELDRIGALVVNKLDDHGFSTNNNPTVDDVQNLVESSLIDSGFPEVAKEYIIYRHDHAGNDRSGIDRKNAAPSRRGAILYISCHCV